MGSTSEWLITKKFLMKICKECGVELEIEMMSCPLCDTPAGSEAPSIGKQQAQPVSNNKHFLKQILWQVTSLVLLFGIVATIVINLSVRHTITWSIYPVTVCLIIFSYASLLARWHTRVIFQLLAGWVLSSAVLWFIQQYLEAAWPLQLAFPLLCAINMIGLLLIITIDHVKVKGLNIVAFVFIAIAGVCLMIEGIISYYFGGVINLQWSVIVAACLLPVAAAIVFMHLRTKNNINMQKIFHT